MKILHITHGLIPGNGFESFLRDLTNNDTENDHIIAVPDLVCGDIGTNQYVRIVKIKSFYDVPHLAKALNIDLIVTHWTGPEGVFRPKEVELVLYNGRFSYRNKPDIEIDADNHPFGYLMIGELLKDYKRVCVFHSEFKVPLQLTMPLFMDYAVFVTEKAKQSTVCNQSVIYNGIDLKKFKPFKTKQRISDKFTIGWLGRLEKYDHNIYSAIKKEKQLNDKCLFVYCGDGELDRDHLPNHCFIGNVNNPTDWLNKFDLFLYPTRVDSFGLAVVEAMACGLPVIASEVVSSVCGDGAFIYSTPEKALIKLYNCLLNSDMLRKMSIAARKQVIRKYELNVMVMNYQNLFKFLMN